MLPIFASSWMLWGHSPQCWPLVASRSLASRGVFSVCALSSAFETRRQSTPACCQPLISYWSQGSSSDLAKSTTRSTRSCNWCRSGSVETAGDAYDSCVGPRHWQVRTRTRTGKPDGWSQRGLRKLLRVSRARLRYLVASGMLRVRDPRIIGSSLSRWREKNEPAGDSSNNHRPRTTIVEENGYSWKRAAKLLGITVEDTQRLIAEGQLKLLDTFVTDRSFEDFCRKHGSEINLSLMDAATRKWLMTEYGISETADRKPVPRAQKHALIVRECTCGRKIAGNVYFRHLRHCRPPRARTMDRIV